MAATQEMQRNALLSTLQNAGIEAKPDLGHNRTGDTYTITIAEKDAKKAADAIEKNSFHDSTILVADGKIIATGKNAAKDPEVIARLEKEAKPVEAPVQTPPSPSQAGITSQEQAVMDAAGADKILTKAEAEKLAASAGISGPANWVIVINNAGTDLDRIAFTQDGATVALMNPAKLGITLDKSFEEGKSTVIPMGGKPQAEGAIKR